MSLWKIDAQRMVEYEIVVNAETEGQARGLARQAIEDGPKGVLGVVDYVKHDTGLDIWSRGMNKEGKWTREATE